MKSNLYIPKTLKIGFQKRADTYTGKLAYITYIDEKNVLRKENSWEGWRDKNIEVLTIENNPINGFVFNKGVQRDGHFGSGRSIIRIYDSRDFEFEISIDNLIGVLMNSDVSKREIDGKFVFAWAGKDLILLPVASKEYQDSVRHTEKQFKNITAKDLKIGCTYSLKKGEDKLVYVGNFKYYDPYIYSHTIVESPKGKKHVFYSLHKKQFDIPTIEKIAECIDDNPSIEYADIFSAFNESIHSSAIKSVNFIPPQKRIFKNSDNISLYKKIDDILFHITLHSYHSEVKKFNINNYRNGLQYPFQIKPMLLERSNKTGFVLNQVNKVSEAPMIRNINKLFNKDFYSIQEMMDILINDDFKVFEIEFENGQKVSPKY